MVGEKMDEQFAKDFIALQAEIQTMPKDKKGYGYKYTDLDTIISYLKPLMKKHNIGFMQVIRTENDVTGIQTTVFHSSGDFITGFCAIPEVQLGKANNAQNIGAAITYMKRYTLSAIFGISSDEDVDCSTQIQEQNHQTYKSEKKSAPQKKVEPQKEEEQKKLYSKEQAEEIGKLLQFTYEDGTPIFNAEDKAFFKDYLKKEGGDACFDSVNRTIAERQQKYADELEHITKDGLF